MNNNIMKDAENEQKEAMSDDDGTQFSYYLTSVNVREIMRES